MSGPGELAMLAGSLVDAGLKATVVLGAAGAVTWALRRQAAAARHAVWAVAFGLLPTLPLLALARGPAVAIDAPWLVGGWGAGAVLASVPLVRGLVQLRRLRAESTPDAHDPQLRRHPSVGAPMTWGGLRPVVVVPEGFERWSARHQHAALAHEQAHVRRGDWLAHLLAWSVCVLFWFHPLAWWARRALMRDAEHAADDVVLASGVRPSDYAELLLSLARPRAGAALGVGTSEVSARVRAVLRPADRRPSRRRAVVTTLLAGALLLPPLAAWPAWTAPPEASLTCQPDPGRLLP